jgi:hypothetical protein
VLVGAEMMRVLDCRDLFVDIVVSEVNYDEIVPGQEANVRVLGSGNVIKGVVQSVRGSSADIEEKVLAASLPQTRDKNARIRVRLDHSSLNSDYENFCQVGRSVQVRFDGKRPLSISQWASALWFSVL